MVGGKKFRVGTREGNLNYIFWAFITSLQM